LMEVLLYVSLLTVLLVSAALLMPVKVFLRFSGDTEEGYEVEVRTMLFSGLAGGGIHRRRGSFRLQFLFYRWRLLDLDVTGPVSRLGRKAAEKERSAVPGEVKREEEAERPTVVERLRGVAGKVRMYRGYGGKALRAFREIIRLERVSADVTLGLGNPAVTGWLTGFLFSLNDVLPGKFAVSPKYDFKRRVMGGEITVVAAFVSIMFWKNLVVLSPDIFHIIRSRKKREKTFIAQEV